MRTLIISAIAGSLLTFAVPAEAHGKRHFGVRYYHPAPVYRPHWVAPAVIGGAIAGAAIYHYASPPVTYVETVPANRPVVCTEWREIRTEDGQIKQERTCYQQ